MSVVGSGNVCPEDNLSNIHVDQFAAIERIIEGDVRAPEAAVNMDGDEFFKIGFTYTARHRPSEKFYLMTRAALVLNNDFP